MAVLTLNAGSSSLKFALFDGRRARLRGEVESIDQAPRMSLSVGQDDFPSPPGIEGSGHGAVLPRLLDWLGRGKAGAEVSAVGHRIVHGGERDGAALVDDGLIDELERLCPLAPLHQPHNIAAIRAVSAVSPKLTQVACFDTAFHRTLPDVARRHALPARFGMRRYGFHGLSYEYIAAALPAGLRQARVVVAHLGSGASLCALEAGRSIETTMSTTPLDGLVMATRCGSLDPGVVLALVRQHGLEATEHALYHESGLAGVSGIGPDMRKLHQAGGADAEAAIDLFVHRLVMDIAAMAAAMGGMDGLVFTAGIGEHDAAIREAVAAKLAWMGRFDLLVIPTDEESVIARQVAEVTAGPRGAATPSG